MKLEDRSLAYTTFGVLLCHAAIIGWFVFFSKPVRVFKPAEKLVVKTVSLQTPPQTQQKKISSSSPNHVPQQKIPASPQQQKEKSQPQTAVKKTQKNNPSNQKAAAKTEAIKEKSEKREMSQKEEMLQRAKENIAKLRQTRDNLLANREPSSLVLEDVGTIESLNIDNEDIASSEDAGYYALLSSRLKQALRLPEIGSVRIILTLDRQGNVVKLETVAAESEYNKKFVEATLKKVQFHPFGQCFKEEGCHAFSITLANDL